MEHGLQPLEKQDLWGSERQETADLSAIRQEADRKMKQKVKNRRKYGRRTAKALRKKDDRILSILSGDEIHSDDCSRAIICEICR